MSHYKTEIAIIGIVILEGIALIQGIDGQMLSVGIGVIAGLGGYQYGKKKE